MKSESKRGIAVASGTLATVMVGYVTVLILVAPAEAESARSNPPPAVPGPVLPAQGQFERAVSMAEAETGGVAIKAEAKSPNVYEIDVILGNEEIEVRVDTTSGGVDETEREAAEFYDD
jgi:hypothetical protein